MKKLLENLKSVIQGSLSRAENLTRSQELKWESSELEAEYHRRMILLGEKVYDLLVKQNNQSLSTADIKEELSQCIELEEKLEKIQQELNQLFPEKK